MLFSFYCLDRTDHTHVRSENRDDHIAYLKAQGEKVISAGPFLSDDGEAMVGSLLIIDFPDRVAAETFAAGDPYAKAGLFESVEIRPWKKVI